MHACGEVARFFKCCVYVVAYEVESGLGHEAYVAYGSDAVRCQTRQEAAVGVGDFIDRERGDDAGHELHGGRFAHDAGELAFVVFVVASAHGGHAVAGHAQLGQRAGVEPQRVRVARIQGHGTVGVGLVERMLAGHRGDFPAVFAPALRQKPAGRTSFRQRLETRHAVGFGFAEEAFGQRTRVESGMEGVQVRVVQAGTDEGAAVVDRAGVRSAVGVGLGGVDDGLDAAVLDADRGGTCLVASFDAREDALARDDDVGVHGDLLLEEVQHARLSVRRRSRRRRTAVCCGSSRVFVAVRKRESYSFAIRNTRGI